MRLIFPLAFVSLSVCLFADQNGLADQQVKVATAAAGADQIVIQRAQAEYEKIKSLVDAGALPRVRLEQAQNALNDAHDEAVLRQSLYGNLSVQETTREQVQEMVSAAQRLYETQKLRLDEAEKLVNQGVTARSSVTPILEDLDSRRRTLDLAQSRARLWDELAALAKAEALREAEPGNPSEMGNSVYTKYVGKGSFEQAELLSVESAFEKKFRKALPISAMGETALHRSLGFDHRGRVDVAVNPDQPEGVWLRGYLEAHTIPYFAFRAAVSGKATGPHIHMGPPSTRLELASVPVIRKAATVRLVRAKAKTPAAQHNSTVVAD